MTMSSSPPYTDSTSIATILLLELALWVPFFSLAPYALKKAMTPTGLLEGVAKRDQVNYKKLLGVDLTLDEVRQNWCDWMCIGCNHLVNGLCALPLFMSASPTPTHWALFVAGLMGEVAFDLFDLLRRWNEQLYKPGGTVGGWVAVFLTTCHHPCSILMAVPMLLYKPFDADFHALVFSLMFAGGVAITGGFGCQVLNIQSAAGLTKMRLINAVVASVVVWARVWVFFPTSYRLLALFYAEVSGAMMAGVGVIGVGMLLFNLFFVADWLMKFAKVMQMTPERTDNVKVKVEELEAAAISKEASEKVLRARSSQLTRQGSFASAAA